MFDKVLEGCALEVNYIVNDSNYIMGYYLVNGIYSKWPTFIKTISRLQGNKWKLFAKYQEGQRKEVE